MSKLPHKNLVRAILLMSLFGSLGATLPAQIPISSGLRADRPARTMKDLRDQNLVRQQFDFSCGAAALATLMSYGFGEDVTEGQILTDMFEPLSDAERLERNETGFSLLDLQGVAERRGYNAEGFRLEPAQLPMLAGPVIVFIEPRGYAHFAVLRGVRGDRVYLADPSRGNIRMPVWSFIEDWVQDDGRGIVFIVEPETGLPDTAMPLTLPEGVKPRPEIMTARELLSVGNPLVHLP